LTAAGLFPNRKRNFKTVDGSTLPSVAFGRQHEAWLSTLRGLSAETSSGIICRACGASTSIGAHVLSTHKGNTNHLQAEKDDQDNGNDNE
jgi:hypothetical protein